MPLALFPGTVVDPLTPEEVHAGRRTRLLGREVHYWPVLASTNDVAREQAAADTPEGLLVLAEEQRFGRGRRGRRWEAPLGSSLLASLLLRPAFLPPAQSFLLTALAALGIAEAIARQTGLQPAIKWPNDLLLSGRKVCGILIELESRPDRLEWAVLGWGLNVNTSFAGDAALRQSAISLAEAAGRPFPRLPLLWACLERLEAHYEAARAGRGETVWAAWRARLETLGRQVAVAAPGGTIVGRAIDVSRDGALLVEQDGGEVARVLAGDVTVRS